MHGSGRSNNGNLGPIAKGLVQAAGRDELADLAVVEGAKPASQENKIPAPEGSQVSEMSATRRPESSDQDGTGDCRCIRHDRHASSTSFFGATVPIQDEYSD